MHLMNMLRYFITSSIKKVKLLKDYATVQRIISGWAASEVDQIRAVDIALMKSSK